MSDSVRLHGRQPTRLPCPWDYPGKNTGVGFPFLLQCMKVKSESEVAQSCPTLSDPMDYSLPGSSVHRIFQGGVLLPSLSASVRSIPFLSFIVCIFAWYVPLVSLIFLKRSLVFHILVFSCISLHWSLRKIFLSLLAVLWNSACKWVYLSFSPLPLASLLSYL